MPERTDRQRPAGGPDRPADWTDRGGPTGAGTDRRGPPGAGTDRPPPTVTSVNRPRTSTRWWARVIRDAGGELRRAGFEIALLEPAQRAARGQPVVDPGGLPVAGHLEQVRAHRVDPVMPGERGVRGRSGFGRGQLPQTRRRAVHRDPRPGRHRRWGCRLLSQPEPAVRHAARRPAEVQCHVAKVDLAVCAAHRRGVTGVTAVTWCDQRSWLLLCC